MFDKADDPEELEHLSDVYLHEKILETQIKCTYLFAKMHSLGQFSDPPMEEKLASMLGDALEARKA